MRCYLVLGCVSGTVTLLLTVLGKNTQLTTIAAPQIVPARDGTLRVLRAARDAGVKRVVVTSSFAAIGYRAPLFLAPVTGMVGSRAASTRPHLPIVAGRCQCHLGHAGLKHSATPHVLLCAVSLLT